MDIYFLMRNWKDEPTEAQTGDIDAIAVWESSRPFLLNVYEMAVRFYGTPTFYAIGAKFSKVEPSCFEGAIENSSLHIGVRFTLMSDWLITNVGRYRRDPDITVSDITVVHMPNRQLLDVWRMPNGICLAQTQNTDFGTKDFYLGGRLCSTDLGVPYLGPKPDVRLYRSFDNGTHTLLITGEDRWPSSWEVFIDGHASDRVTHRCRVIFTGPTTMEVTVFDD